MYALWEALMKINGTILLILALATFISWLNYYLLSRLFVFYRGKVSQYMYWGFTVATILTLGYGWSIRPPFVDAEHAVYRFLVYGTLAWLVGQIVLLVLQPLLAVMHRVLKGGKVETDARSTSSLTMTRRNFLHSSLAAAPLLSLGMGMKGIYNAQSDMVVQRYSLHFSNLPANLTGFKIVQISDTHLGPYFDLDKLDTVIALLMKEKPDIIVITGDFVDDLNLLTSAIERLNTLQPLIPHGIYFCYGNHEYFRDIQFVRAELKKSRIHVLENQSALIVPGTQPFYLMGVGYPWAGDSRSGINVSTSVRQQYFATTDQNIPKNAFKVLVGHHPDILIDGFSAQIPLTLAGHTHGGQVIIGGRSLLASYTYMSGLYQTNGVYGYVSNGTGHWFPFRLGCPPEISVFTLLA